MRWRFSSKSCDEMYAYFGIRRAFDAIFSRTYELNDLYEYPYPAHIHTRTHIFVAPSPTNERRCTARGQDDAMEWWGGPISYRRGVRNFIIRYALVRV